MVLSKEKGSNGQGNVLSLKRRQGFRKTKRYGEHIGLSSIRRLARRGGVKRISGGVYEETRTCLEHYLQRVLKDLVLLVEHADRFTVTVMDVVYALKKNGQALYGYGDVYPQTRAQRVAQLRQKRITLKQDEEGGHKEEDEVLDDVTVALVQKLLADYFLRERSDLCRIQTLLYEVNQAKDMSLETLRTCLNILQSRNCIMCSSDDIYLI